MLAWCWSNVETQQSSKRDGGGGRDDGHMPPEERTYCEQQAI